MKKTIICLICLCSSLGIFGYEQSLDVDQIIEKHIHARGGKEIVKNVHTLKYSGIYSRDGQEFPFECFVMSPNLYRINFGFYELLYDGNDLWQISGTQFKKVDITNPIAREQATYLQVITEIEGPLLGYKEKGYKIELLGKAVFDGEPVYELKIVRHNGRTENWYIDCETYLVKMKGYEIDFGKKFGSYGPLPIKVYLSDYKPINRFMFPFYNERTCRLYHETQVTEKVEVNVPLDKELFLVSQR